MCWLFLLLPGWQIAETSPMASLNIHDNIVITMGPISVWNTHIHSLAKGQSHPPGDTSFPIRSCFFCLYYSIQKIQTTDHFLTSQNICCFLFLCSFPLAAVEEGPLPPSRVHAPLLPHPSPWKISSYFLSTLAASLWLKPSVPHPQQSLSSTLISPELPSHLPSSFHS